MPLSQSPTAALTRCAIYTRKSTEHGLDMAFNSLETQRDVCRAYIKCNEHRRWVELPQRYDDGGYTGASLERPALQRLMADVEAGRIDLIVVYKIDRLTRSLSDFVRLIDVLERYKTSFVSVTQTFDTSDSMGRLVLNVLLTFAQFERELMSDRVRDKKAAMQRKGLFAGGTPPTGYIVEDGRLVTDPERAPWVREIFLRYSHETGHQIARDLRARGCMTRSWVTKEGREHGGQPLHNRTLYGIIGNPIYTGHLVHRGEWVRAEHEAIVTREEWDIAQAVRQARYPALTPERNFLAGILHDEHGRKFRTHRCGPGRSTALRYYASRTRRVDKRRCIKRFMVDADRVEELAIGSLKALLSDQSQLRSAILSLGRYSREVERALKNGRAAARQIDAMDAAELKRLFAAVVPLAEVSATGLCMYVSCHELSRFLEFDGRGRFDREPFSSDGEYDRFYIVRAPGCLICGKPRYTLPVLPRPADCAAEAAPGLVRLLREASELREYMLAHRTMSIPQMAKNKRMGPSNFARMLRLNYLAPDIQAAIHDGTQPPDLTIHKLLFGAMPLDWEQQRQLYGFS